mmetsp:Transcript_11430/g.20535  ORF Transcript_11430/g.20535 Transcript_11430/m.20535 type:complete len:285 (+) Transcript_11430:620-1474(+)
MASTALRMLAAGAPISLGTHNLAATVRAADAPSFAFSTSGNVDSRARAIGSPSDSSTPTTMRSATSAASTSDARPRCRCDFGSSLVQSAITASRFDTSLYAASLENFFLVPSSSSSSSPSRSSAAFAANDSVNRAAASSALRIAAATSGSSSPPPKIRRNTELVAVQLYSSPMTRSEYGAYESTASNHFVRAGRPSRMSTSTARGSWIRHRSNAGIMMASAAVKSAPRRKCIRSPPSDDADVVSSRCCCCCCTFNAASRRSNSDRKASLRSDRSTSDSVSFLPA